MAGLIKREDIDEVRQRTDIKEVVDGYVTLKGAGLGSYKGLCPFHDERSPSFTVRPQVGRYHCFGCGEDGDVISFVQKLDHISFHEAVEKLAAPDRLRAPLRGRRLRPQPGGHRPAPAAAGRAQGGRRVLPRPAADPGRRRGPQLPLRPRLRPGGGRTVRRGLRPAGLGLAAQAPPRPRLHGPGTQADRHVLRRRPGDLRPFPRPADLAHPGHRRRHHRLRRPQALRGRPGPEVPEHPRDRALQEVPGPLRDRPRQAQHRQGPPARGGGRLHRRHGLPPGRHSDGGSHVRHRLRHRAHQDRPPAALRRRQRGRGHLHLRRRRRRPEGGAARLRRGPAVRRADLRGGRTQRRGPLRAAPVQGRLRRPGPDRQPPPAVRVRHPRHPEAAQPGHRRGPDRGPA